MRTTGRQIPFLMLAGLTSFLSACGGVEQAIIPIDVRDTGASVVSVRADWHFRSQATGTLGEVRDGVEVQYVRMKGSDDQTIPPGQAIALNGGTIIGPRTVSHNAEVSYGHIAYSGTARWPGLPLDIDVFLGTGLTDLHLRSSVTTSASRALQDDVVDFGLSMGMGLRWWFVEKAAVEGRIIIFTQNPFWIIGGGFGKGYQTDMLETELALVYRPIRQVALRGGYAFMSLTPEKNTNESPLEVTLGGPFIGLTVSF